MEPQIPKKEESIWELIKFIIMVCAIVIPIRMFVAKPFVVSGDSMIDTFHNRDFLIIDELTYRFHQPARGDIIVFHPPYDNNVYYIKRIIGLPGETVTIHGSQVVITNKSHPEGITLSEPYLDHINGEKDVTLTVDPEHYFVMGDNRPRSSDSRYWGELPRDHITGRVLIRLFPFNQINIFPGAYATYQADK